jgi:hypothetical protein
MTRAWDFMMPPARRFLFPLSLEANLSPPCGEDPAMPVDADRSDYLSSNNWATIAKSKISATQRSPARPLMEQLAITVGLLFY